MRVGCFIAGWTALAVSACCSESPTSNAVQELLLFSRFAGISALFAWQKAPTSVRPADKEDP